MMTQFTIHEEMINSESLPPFTLTIEDTYAATVYSDTEMQAELVKVLENNGKWTVFDQQEGLYQRLTVEENITFFHKWFGCETPLPEILVLFELQNCAKKTLHKCSESDIRRVYFAKYFMSGVQPMIFREPIHGADVRTMNTFMNMLQKLRDHHIPVMILVSNMEHALLLGDIAYKLQKNGIQQIEIIEAEESASEAKNIGTAATANFFKVPAKVDDKMILFDPLEIDYIESQDGKAMIVVQDESYAMDSTLAEIEKKLAVYGFYRCHRSYIVNLQKVREIITWSKNTYSLRIDNKSQSTIPLSRTKIQDIQEKFSLK
ncbi:LytTR family transcriptional regulator DNA-binding domain-containing protein [Bacillus sp. LB7]|nr:MULTISPECIES: LytTR family transcriptional regulator DNA-binding domain-containing protein [Bacillus]MDN5388932.1 LytTR family transcriptional regulator DNA-binding domain-containing protein [Bacillus sp. LB7]MEC1027956.1 LytTR family transcriptional regulator DNA-binding domain-containing protein [Bacillus paralicheniformis]MEC1080583.1 LytTR family transcriptional regulator DNA-binding domain-containing protein [Bacillus paralicheniformis]MEC1098682.1 LytTR family transcriptional regulator